MDCIRLNDVIGSWQNDACDRNGISNLREKICLYLLWKIVCEAKFTMAHSYQWFTLVARYIFQFIVMSALKAHLLFP